MSRQKWSAVLLGIALVLASAAATGCAGSAQQGASALDQTSTVTPTAEAPLTPSTAPGVYSVDAGGVLVTLEVTTVAQVGEAWMPEGNVGGPEASSGNRVLWLRLTAENSSDAPVYVTVAHNVPSLRDSTGRTVPYLFPVGWSGLPRGEMPPGTSAVAVVPYDAPVEPQRYTVTWTLSPEAEAVITFDVP